MLNNKLSLAACFLLLLGSGTGCAAESEDAAEDEATSASADAPLSEKKQPKVAVSLMGGDVIGAGACLAGVNVRVTIEREELRDTRAELVFTDIDTGWTKVLRSYEVEKDGLFRSRAGIVESYPMGPDALRAFATHKVGFEVVQRRPNGKVVGTSGRQEFVISEPRIDLASVTRSTTCASDSDASCYLATYRIYPSDVRIAESDYTCDPLRLELRTKDQTMEVSLSNRTNRGGSLESAVSYPLPSTEPVVSAVLKHENSVSNEVLF